MQPGSKLTQCLARYITYGRGGRGRHNVAQNKQQAQIHFQAIINTPHAQTINPAINPEAWQST